ncbi:MAG: IS200/IS605 family element transposase accessory protein TnpB [Symploca sp. SIO1A3]|nr:IS200/IS605 family element transposase accessory protein TnpB [Symploca sp. SIO1A3]
MLVLEYKAVVKPNQVKAIDEAIRTTQFVRNKVLRYWMDNHGIGKKELYQYNTQLRAQFWFVKHLNSHACQASVENVERAIHRFFDNCKKKKPGKKGYPRFKKNCRSVEYKQSGWKLHSSKRRLNFIDKKGIGEVKLLGKWDIHTYPVELIKRVQRKIYKKKKGSSGRRKARSVYARKHLKVTRQRNEHAKRLARNLCLANAKVVLEDLNISGLVRNHKLAKSISDASWYNFRQWLEYFGDKFGREIIAVAPHYTSQECSNCGIKVQKSLSTRTHSCPHCGYIEQRDVNAAIVILSRATTEGHSGSNANGDVSSTSVGRKTCRGKKRR